MFEFFRNLFNTDGFPARWHCGIWSGGHGWLHIVSDLLVFGAYTAIPVTLAILAWKRHQDLLYSKIVWLFGAFIFACGLTHLIDASIFFHPWYRLSGTMKAITAIVSWATVITVIRVLPQALTLPGLPKVNRMLEEALQEQRRVTVELEKSQEQFSALVNNVPGIVFQLKQEEDGRLDFTFLSRGTQDLFAHSSESLRADVSLITVALDWRSEGGFTRALKESGKHCAALSWEGSFINAAGETRWVHVQAKARQQDEGVVIWDGMFVDTTELHSTQEALRESEAWTSNVLEATQDAFITVDAEGRILDSNPATERMFGIPADQLPGTPLAELGLLAEDGDQAMVGEAPTDQEHFRKVSSTAQSRAGRQFPYEASVRRMEGRRGQVTSWHVRDITEQVEQERILTETLEEAKRANLAKSEFLSRMSHELRTPLNAILGFSQLLMRRNLEARDKDSLKLMHTAGQHLLDLINEVLDLAKIESGKLNCSIEPVDVPEVMEEMRQLSQGLVENVDVELDFVQSEEMDCYVYADRQRLRQVLLNLISNAIKYNKPGGKVWVKCALQEDMLRFTVKDNGQGISEIQLKKLFRPFERLGADQGPVDGAGIGLALSQCLAQLMGTEIQVESTFGEGSEFSFELPLAIGNSSPATSSTKEPATGTLPAEVSEDARHVVLYVEDNPVNLQLMECIFEDAPQWEFHSAATGQQGIERAIELDPDLIMLDLHLPDLNGDKVLTALRKHPQTKDTRIVMVSAAAMKEQIELLSGLGADDYVTKPVILKRIIELLASFDDDSTLAMPG